MTRNIPIEDNADVGHELDTIGEEYDCHRKDDEANEDYAERIVAQLENMIDELLELQERVHDLIDADA